MGDWRGKLVAQDENYKLWAFENGDFKPMAQPTEFRSGTISSVIPYSADTILVTTINNGIWAFSGGIFSPWKTQDDGFLKSNTIFCATLRQDGKLAIGTSLSGIVTLDRSRRVFHHINKKSGLQNNTVLSLFSSKNGSLWAGLDNGIDCVDIDSPFSYIFPDGELQGTGYAALVANGRIFFGTNSGLYATRWKPWYTQAERQNFTKIQRSEGQVWSLNNLDGQVMMGHHEGSFVIKGDVAEKNSPLRGVWRLLQISPNEAIAGHYNGISTFFKKKDSWQFGSTIEGLAESSRLLAKDEQGQIWMAHPYRGIFRVKIGPDGMAETTFFGAKSGLPSSLGNHLFQLLKPHGMGTEVRVIDPSMFDEEMQ